MPDPLDTYDGSSTGTDSLDALLGLELIDATTRQSGILTRTVRQRPGQRPTVAYFLQAPGRTALAINPGTILVDGLRNSFSVLNGGTFRSSGKLTADDINTLFPGLGSSAASTQTAEEAAYLNAQAQRLRDQTAIDREQLALERENQARQEREARLNALLDNIRYLNEIQPDLARFGAGLNSVPLQGITPTVGYGNALEGNIKVLEGQIANPPPLGTPIPQVVAPQAPGVVPQGMREGGSFAANGNITFGSNKLGTLVGEERSGIDGSAEVVVHDKNTGQLLEVIPLAGQAAGGASYNWDDMTQGLNTAKWDTTSLYGALSPLYQPFGITSAGLVPTRANAGPTSSLGYIQPKFTTDFAPAPPPAYGALSQRYFEKNTGFELPNPSTIMAKLRAQMVDDPVGFANTLSFYENSTDQQGNPSGLPKEAIIAMLENSALTGTSGTSLIGIR